MSDFDPKHASPAELAKAARERRHAEIEAEKAARKETSAGKFSLPLTEVEGVTAPALDPEEPAP